MTKHSQDSSFGDQSVTTEQRTKSIRHVFEVVADRYDLMNDFMSFGIHRLWKAQLTKMVNATDGQFIVDLAGGTGDVASRIAGPKRQVAIVDPGLEMVRVAKERRLPHVQLIAATGEAIPVKDNAVDTLTIAFGIRNMTSMNEAMREILRVLKPGGRCYCLEFSKPAALIRPFYNFYSSTIIPRLGAMVANQPAAYHYLVESIRRFPDQEEMKSLFEEAGFSDVSYKNLSFGIACIHIAQKSPEVS